MNEQKPTRLIPWFIKKSIEIIQEKGIIAFIKKTIGFSREYFDKYQIKILSRFYINGFHKLSYYFYPVDTTWMGVRLTKCPLDAWIYQEIIYETRPEVIIETGTAQGGSALFFASLCDMLKKGEVITIDIVDDGDVLHHRIHKIIGDSVSDEVISQVKEIAGNKTVMVVLDSAHNKEHVLKEMELYCEFVSIGNYMVVEDTNLSGHPVHPSWGKGPMEAIEEFMRNREDFEIDRTREKFYLTFHPRGFLRRCRQSQSDQIVCSTSGSKK